MSQSIHPRSKGDESVVQFASACLTEAFQLLLHCWERSVEHGRQDQESIHDLRIAARRAESAMHLFSDWLPARSADELLEALHALRKSAGAARDCDVLQQRLVASSAGEKRAERFHDHINAQRMAAQATLVGYYEKCDRGERIEQLLAELVRTLQPRGSRHRETLRFADWAPRYLRSQVREFFHHADLDGDDLEALHAFRIEAKKIRYMFEIVSPVLNSAHFEKAMSSLKKLSQRLGEINDHDNGIATISRWMETELDPNSMEILRQLRKDARRALRVAVGDFVEWWTSRRRRQIRRRLKQATKMDVAMSSAIH